MTSGTFGATAPVDTASGRDNKWQMANSPESSVREYLLFLEDPAQLRDDTEISKLSTAVEQAKDPIAKLKAIAALDKAQTVDPSATSSRSSATLRPGLQRTAFPQRRSNSWV